ncbi:1-phosphofructokinase family hexose kinase [Nocardioides mesophilus]|uniref:1-phosphofructokinase family hexose kinase n=1 Tax=Nocardioides mesophilus TaxID=433659 RepID=A0A7G9R9D5_9ACTN|nr:1-phosphofructokinase family hexose kinase [Nocardioides mesophilus]QNN52210.1 1-phosphofructokinase family hexose kinase [Nocardioides mesophilus]
MIVTLTPNPSIDRTIALASPLERGAVLRAVSVTSQSAGKGVNISRAAVAAGVPTIAVMPAAQDDPYVHELLRDGIDCRPEPPAGAVRMNVTLTEPDGTTTKINSPGATVTAASLDRLRAALHQRAAGAGWVVLAGSLPPGTPPEWYADVVADLQQVGVPVAVDTSDAPLIALADRLETAAPDLLKPNAEELASLTGGDAEQIEADPLAAAAAARVLVHRGVRSVLATLGAGGAVLVTADGAWHATPPPTTVVSTVGAGDSSLFGFLLGSLRELPPSECLRLAVAYGSAAAALPGTTIPTPDHLHPELVDLAELPVPAET